MVTTTAIAVVNTSRNANVSGVQCWTRLEIIVSTNVSTINASVILRATLRASALKAVVATVLHVLKRRATSQSRSSSLVRSQPRSARGPKIAIVARTTSTSASAIGSLAVSVTLRHTHFATRKCVMAELQTSAVPVQVGVT